jgi:hypothetical protein
MSGFTIATLDGPLLSAANINLTSTGNPIAAVTGSIIRVYRLFLTVTTAAGTVQFTDGTTVFASPLTFAAGVPLVLPMDGQPWFVCGKGNPFTITLSAAGQVSGAVYFTQQPL